MKIYKLYVDITNSKSKPDFPLLEKTWFNKFWQLLTENCQKEGLEDRFRSIALIVFNYDRCIEHFLYYSLQNSYGINADDATKLVNSIDIYHPYGVVGHLPWQHRGDSIGFGAEPHSQQLLELAEQIKTFTEGTNPASSEIMAIKNNMLNAELVLFLGFAFHKLTIQLIMPDHSSGPGARSTNYFATASGISDSDCEIIRKEIYSLSKSGKCEIKLRNDKTCSEIFNEYWRSFSLY